MDSSCSSSSSSSPSPISVASSPLPLSRSTKNRQQTNLGFRAVNSNCNNIPVTPARNYVDGVGSSRTTSVDNDDGVGDSSRTCNTNASVPAVNRQHHCTTTANSNKNQQRQQSADNNSTPVQELLQLLDHTEFHDLPKFPKEFRMDDYAQRQRLRPRESSSATAKTGTKINRQQEESNNDCSSNSNNNNNNRNNLRRKNRFYSSKTKIWYWNKKQSFIVVIIAL